MASYILQEYQLTQEQINEIENYKKQMPFLQKSYDILMKRTNKHLETQKQNLMQKNVFDEDDFIIQTEFTFKVAYLIFVVETLFTVLKVGASKMKRLIKDKNFEKEFREKIEKKVIEAQEKARKLEEEKQSKNLSEEDVTKKAIKLQKDLFKEYNKILLTSPHVGTTKATSVMEVITSEDFMQFCGPDDVDSNGNIKNFNGKQIKDYKKAKGLNGRDKPRVDDDDNFMLLD